MHNAHYIFRFPFCVSTPVSFVFCWPKSKRVEIYFPTFICEEFSKGHLYGPALIKESVVLLIFCVCNKTNCMLNYSFIYMNSIHIYIELLCRPSTLLYNFIVSRCHCLMENLLIMTTFFVELKLLLILKVNFRFEGVYWKFGREWNDGSEVKGQFQVNLD